MLLLLLDFTLDGISRNAVKDMKMRQIDKVHRHSTHVNTFEIHRLEFELNGLHVISRYRMTLDPSFCLHLAFNFPLHTYKTRHKQHPAQIVMHRLKLFKI